MGKDGKRPASGEEGGGKSKKAKYLPGKEGLKSGSALPIGKQGILVTLEGHAIAEKSSKEALLVLNEVYELLDPQSRSSAQKAAEAEDAKEGATDFSNLIANEVTDLKDKRKQRFRFCNTGLQNCMFLEMEVEEGKPGPVEVVDKLLRDALATRRLQFRSCSRFLPCTHIFKWSPDTLESNAATIVPQLIDCTPEAKPESVAVLYEHRSADGLDRMKIINAFVDHVPRPPHTVKLKGATKTISVQIVRNAVGVAVIKDYHELQRCNIRAICEPPKKQTPADSKPAAAAAAAPQAAVTADTAGKPAVADAAETSGKPQAEVAGDVAKSGGAVEPAAAAAEGSAAVALPAAAEQAAAAAAAAGQSDTGADAVEGHVAGTSVEAAT